MGYEAINVLNNLTLAIYTIAFVASQLNCKNQQKITKEILDFRFMRIFTISE